jgi:hypothetical protein
MTRDDATRTDEDERTPPIADPIWEKWSAPLLRFLYAAPRTWPEIHAWREATDFRELHLRHCIAWLEDRHLAKAIEHDGVVAWVAQSWFSTCREGTALEEPLPDPLDEAMSLDAIVEQAYLRTIEDTSA